MCENHPDLTPLPEHDPHAIHRRLMAEAPLRLAYRGQDDVEDWRAQLMDALRSCLGRLPDRAPADARMGEPQQCEGYTVRQISFQSEPGARVPCRLLVPDGLTAPAPAVICLQGHSSGAHISLGERRYPTDPSQPAGDRDFALQVVRRGHIALALEQRCFGERSDGRSLQTRTHFDPARPTSDERCRHSAMVALLLGRTLAGERVWDTMRAVDFLCALPEVDASRIACMGNSGGGTITYYAACLDSRISVAMPSCSFANYRASIGEVDHCCDNYLPAALQFFEMPDLAGLIAPRPLVVVSGLTDPLFPIDDVRVAFAHAKGIYARLGLPDKCRLVVGPEGHRFYADLAWPVFDAICGW